MTTVFRQVEKRFPIVKIRVFLEEGVRDAPIVGEAIAYVTIGSIIEPVGGGLARESVEWQSPIVSATFDVSDVEFIVATVNGPVHCHFYKQGTPFPLWGFLADVEGELSEGEITFRASAPCEHAEDLVSADL